MKARSLAVALGLLPAAAGATWAQDRPQQALPPLITNETGIVDALRPSALAIDDGSATFSYVLRQLPPRVQVYPTENYFYVRFIHNGVPYTANIRLAAADRDQGKVNFAYGEQPTDWNDNPPHRHLVLGAEQGVTVEKVEALAYRVSHAGHSVTFVLNDLSQVMPPPGLLKPDEQYLGPVFDESGLYFFFVFNRRLKIFHFILDETGRVGDELVPLKGSEMIRIGKRTGFAFYQFEDRKILVGVHERESRLNTEFDGPFDQLPENFIAGEALRDAILAVNPALKGKIDRLGNFADGTSRYLINPYLLYRQASDLLIFPRCVSWKTVAPADRAACFVIDDEEAQKKSPRPLALKRRAGSAPARERVEPQPVRE
jgi:hypothetical protein